MNRGPTILFLQPRRRVFMVTRIQQHLREHYPEYKLAVSDEHSLDPVIQFADVFIRLPATDHPEFENQLLHAVRHHHIAVLFVWNDRDFLPVSALAQQLNALGCRLFMPSEQVLQSCLNKQRLHILLSDHGFDSPRYYSYEEALTTADYPLFIKPEDGSGSMHCHELKTPEELVFYYPRIRRPLIQRFIPGTHYTVDACGNEEGELLLAVPRQRIRAHGSEAIIARIDMHPAVSDIMHRLARILPICGLYNVQMIHHEGDQRFYIHDINPRMSGSVDISVKAGAPFDRWLTDLITGNPVAGGAATNIQDQAVYSKYYESVLVSNA